MSIQQISTKYFQLSLKQPKNGQRPFFVSETDDARVTVRPSRASWVFRIEIGGQLPQIGSRRQLVDVMKRIDGIMEAELCRQANQS